jgi:hypothetical protein
MEYVYIVSFFSLFVFYSRECLEVLKLLLENYKKTESFNDVHENRIHRYIPRLRTNALAYLSTTKKIVVVRFVYSNNSFKYSKHTLLSIAELKYC